MKKMIEIRYQFDDILAKLTHLQLAIWALKALLDESSGWTRETETGLKCAYCGRDVSIDFQPGDHERECPFLYAKTIYDLIKDDFEETSSTTPH
jgi:hypothetical protein